MAAEWNKTVKRGDHWLIQFLMTDGANVPKDASGYEFWYTAKLVVDNDVTDAAALIVLDPADFTIDDGNSTNDRITALVTEAMTGAMEPATYVHDLQVRVGGRISTYCEGDLVITGDVTRRTT